ncbi:hypothetical protein KK137_09880 [Croceibacterium sp. LX-88]|uniref:Uncharacterized protein n=1 Tax=Croceibacterium selenioxidans TaxID=2838833 RepID=A0ABS5W4G2_9SPHN|nr:hypothetical protein [Croceibacterium selenioxidans]MBT2134642.1 hypothetical protein [Croceibacterium selenioxidans]
MTTKTFTWERGPFDTCWKCGEKEAFGILSVGGDRVVKRCTKCRHSHAETLPDLDKKVIYLDQFAFSELHKVRSGTRRPDKWSDFWAQVDDLLTRAVLLQQAVLPHSDIHHKETIVSPFAGALRDTQEAIGGDIEFVSTNDIQLSQIEEFARAFFAGDDPRVTFDVDDVLEGDRNSWLPDMRITVGMDWSSFVPDTRKGRDETHASVASLIEGWRKAGDGFDEVLEREFGAYLASRQDALRHSMKRFEQGLAENDLFALAEFSHGFVQREIELVRRHARKAGVVEDRLTGATTEFWNWNGNREQPFAKISAYLFASLAAQFKGGRSKMPTPGLLNDINAISAYAPYVDAMLVDNECAELLRHGRCLKELSYKARIFSLSSATAFIDYLRSVVDLTPVNVGREASQLYGIG